MYSIDFQHRKFWASRYLVDRLVRPYIRRGTTFEVNDLRQEGYLCLCEAISSKKQDAYKPLKTLIDTRLKGLRRHQVKPYDLIIKLVAAGYPIAQLPDTSAIELDFSKSILQKALDKLEPRQSAVLKMFFGIDQTPMKITDIASILGVSQQMTRRIRKSAYNELIEDPEVQALMPHRFAS